MIARMQLFVARRSMRTANSHLAARCHLSSSFSPVPPSPSSEPSSAASSPQPPSASAPNVGQSPAESGKAGRQSTLTSENIFSSKRAKGFGRKLTLRALNRNVVRRIARRATIGIPLLGMYFACRVLTNDFRQSQNSANPPLLRKMYAGAAMVDAADVASQTVIISSLIAQLFLSDLSLPPLLGELSPIADKVSLGAALVSSSIGTYCELNTEESTEPSSSPER